MVFLFSYGTLRSAEVQRANFGRMLNSNADALVGYRVGTVQIHDQDFIAKNGAGPQKNLEYTGNASDIVEGAVLEITKAELEQADAYEPGNTNANWSNSNPE